MPPRCSIKMIKRIPRAYRALAVSKFTSALEYVVSVNDHPSWDPLLRFSDRYFRAPSQGGHCRSLANAVNKQLNEEADPPILPPSTSNPRKSRKHHDPIITLAANVSGKLEEGDFKVAI